MTSISFTKIWIFFMMVLCFSSPAIAQTVSLLVAEGESNLESLTLEIIIKKLLKEEGYEVKGGSTQEGYMVYVEFMPINTIGGESRGYAGNVVIGSLSWPTIVDGMLPENCNINAYQELKSMVGIEMAFLDSRLFTASSIESLAELIGTSSNRLIRKKAEEIAAIILGLLGT